MPKASDHNDEELPAIIFHDVSKSFNLKHTQSFKEAFIAAIKGKERSSSFNAVSEITFEVPKGQSVALMGRNGSGKSTTLKLLSGVMQPDTGWIRTRGRVAGLLEVGAGFHPDLTGRQNVYLNAAILGMSKEETEARFQDILEFSEIGEFIDTEVKRYSSGMYARLGFSVAVHTELDTLLVDEVLSVGDAQFREKCNNKMLELQELGKTMFIVSHSFGQVKQLCSRGIVLEHGRVKFDGAIDDAIDFLDPRGSRFPGGPLSYPVAGGIGDIWEQARSAYGRPVGPETKVYENGVGWYQRFENGLITFSRALGEGHGIINSPLLETYEAHGGPGGPWGFPAQTAVTEQILSLKAFEFQYGSATRSPGAGFTFVPRS